MKIVLLAFCAAVLAACNSSSTTSNTATTSDSTGAMKTDSANDGWQSLFDGKTTNGWHSYGKPTVGEAWKVVDGALYLDTSHKEGYQTKGGGDLVTNDEYGNFDLKLEWKISPKGNSGIIFYIKEDTSKYKSTWNTGPEMQVLDNDGHPDGKIKKHRAGDLYDLISSSKEPVRPVGQWNEVEIRSDKGKLDLLMNGENIISTMLWDDNWKKLIAGSKFKSMPDFGTFKSGRIGLQDHGNTVWYRNIKIKKL